MAGEPAPPAGDRHPGERARRLWQRRSGGTLLLLLPAFIALTLLFFLPIVRIAIQSFTEPELGLHNYVAMLTDDYSFRVLVRTLVVSGAVALFGALFAYPYAYGMVLASPLVRAVMFTVVLVPLWTSMIARNFAWVVLLQRNGPVTWLLEKVGIDLVLFGTPIGVGLAMSQVLLPFIVLPMYTAMQQIDLGLLNAAGTLGASKRRAFLRVFVPLSMPGVVAGVALAFVLALGFFITPALIGRPQQALIAQLIRIRVSEQLDFGAAGALGIVLLVVTLLVMWLSTKISRRSMVPTDVAGMVQK